MTALLAGFNAALKRLYKDSLPEVGHDPPVTWSLLKKTTGFKGEDKSLPLKYGRSQSSHTFSDAQAQARASSYARFLLTRGNDFHVVQMNGEAMEAAKDEGAVVSYLKEETRSGMDRMSHRLNRNLFRNYGMAQCQILSGSGTTTFTATNADDLLGLDVGDVVVSSVDDGTGGGGLTGTATTITAIDRDAGTVTAAAAWSGTSFADGHYVFHVGDYGLGFYGAASWFPLTPPAVGGGDSFFGRDRSTDPERLAGQRFTALASDGDIERFLKRACTKYAMRGGSGNLLIINPLMWDHLDNQIGDRVRYGKMMAQTSKGAHATLGFDSIEIRGNHRTMNVIADRDCPFNDGYIFDLEHFWWEGLGEAPRYLAYDGMGGVGDNGAWLRISNEDAIEGRIGARGQFASNAPGRCARLRIPNGTVI